MAKAIPEGIRLKLKRANQHIYALKRSADRFMKKEPYDILRNLTEDRLRMELSIEPTRPVPRIWSLIIGDCLFDLRASLDYLACHLSSTDCERTQFPITTTETKFVDAKNRGQLEGIDKAAVTIIEGLQPWKTHPADPSASPLAVLQTLNNLDKHRALHLTYSVLQRAHMKATNPTNIKSVRSFGLGPLNKRTQIAEIDFITPEHTMKMHLTFHVGIAFDEEGPARGRAVNSSLGAIQAYIKTKVLPEFSAYF